MDRPSPLPFPSSLLRKLSLFLLLALSPFPLLFSQTPLSPRVEGFSPSSYQGHKQLFCVELDPQGGVWFGTVHRILHYSGERWKRFPLQKGVIAVDISIDTKGRVWVAGNTDFGYMRIEGGDAHKKGDSAKTKRPGDLSYVSLVPELPDSLQNNIKGVREVKVLEERVLFSSGKRVYLYGPNGFRTYVPQGRKFSFSWKVGDEVWVQDAGHGIHRIGPEDPSPEPPHFSENSSVPGSHLIKDAHIRDVRGAVPGMTEKGEVLVTTGESGQFRFDTTQRLPAKEARFISLDKEKGALGDRLKLNSSALLVSEDIARKEGTLSEHLKKANPWHAPLTTGSLTRGEILVDTNGAPRKGVGKGEGFLSNTIWESVSGKKGSGMVWSATDKGGARWEVGDPRTYAFDGEGFSGSPEKLLRYKGRIVMITGEGAWVRRQKGPLSQEKEKWEKIPMPTEQLSGLMPVFRDGKGKGLFTGGLNALYKITHRKGDREVRKVLNKDATCFDTLDLDSSGTYLFFGGEDGVFLLDPFSEELLFQFHSLPLKPYSIRAELVQREGEGQRVRLWCGSRKGEVLLFEFPWEDHPPASLDPDSLPVSLSWSSLKKGKLPHLKMERISGKGLPQGEILFTHFKKRVCAITEKGLFRPKDHLWKALEEGGKVFGPEKGLGCRFTVCDSTDKGHEMFRVREGKNGEVWVRGESRTYRLVPKKGGTYRYDTLPFRGTGLGSIRGFYPDKNGVTWLLGINGLMQYDPRVEKDFKRRPEIRIEEVEVPMRGPGSKESSSDSIIFGGFYRVPAPEDPLLGWKRSYEQPDPYVAELPYDLNELIFQFTSPYYEVQDEMSYRTKLHPLEDEWSTWRKKNRKDYTGLGPGLYTFKVQAKNVYGVTGEVAEYRFRILPPWYRTWSAYLVYSGVGLGFIWLLVWLNGQRLRAQKRRLEKIVEDRTKEIQEQKESLEQKNEELEEANRTISYQKEEVEEAHHEITQSIDYAQKIQQALLRSGEKLSSEVNELFILFQPQAKVSGDFYWMREHRGYLYLAAVDCTGHGVPGAFMSMLGISQLNEIMNTEKTPLPGEILTELRERVVRELSGSDPESAAKDGMDAALVRVPLDERANDVEVSFAGANNPLYVLREGLGEAIPEVRFKEDLTGLGSKDRIKPFKNIPDGVEFKGDPRPVGYDEEGMEPFNTLTVYLQKGDMLYLFSDGYADQFGGPKGKKFRYGPFKRSLTELYTLDAEKQKAELERIFQEWKGDQEQIDDVLVVGLRL